MPNPNSDEKIITKLQKQLMESESIFRNIVELTQSLIWRCDLEGKFTFLNPG